MDELTALGIVLMVLLILSTVVKLMTPQDMPDSGGDIDDVVDVNRIGNSHRLPFRGRFVVTSHWQWGSCETEQQSFQTSYSAISVAKRLLRHCDIEYVVIEENNQKHFSIRRPSPLGQNFNSSKANKLIKLDIQHVS